ncbi:hypothetical protein CAPTEDRAFT_112007 [Capitella teleta]|uniref:protein-tyrosine-phosphatase n=1 Tax=Capitella teleta TaxID=283909 RepID=R7T5M7_CAPTE|nr:hypothetical protein CAPTEDRAFT_112007 [Capitella teleta]|eukprot:ELT88458.1 hypothetical protein CAPTEDRAFT_112007 [Capitella teleta]
MWRLLWVIDSHRIIMVTNLVENGKRKCEQYWPDKKDEEKVYGGIGVTLRSIEQTADFVIRTFDSTKVSSILTRNIKQFHFTAWPDHGVPQRASPIISFRRKVRSYDQSHPGTMLVHCSAGVGRTGTFIALDFLQDMAEEEQAIDLFNCTMNMRRDRVNMIQTVEQYLFVYDALLEALKAGKTAIPCSSFRREYDLLYQIEGPQDKSRLQVQFETLATMTAEPREDECCSGKMPDNMEKNRFPEVVASDRHRPYLMTRVHGTNDYINAVFLDGYKSKNEYIVTQMPLPHTVIDLWRMIFEHNVGSVIMINPWDPNNESYGQYWPESGEDCECGPFVIESVATDKPHPDVLVRELRLIYQPQDSKPHTVNQFVLKSWPKDALCPDNKAAIIALINVVEKSQYKTGNGPLIMHCHNGIEASGLMAAISCVWDKMKVDQEVDIFHTVKQLRYHAPLAVQHLEQYDFLYQMVLAYLDEYETYANFR